MSTPTESDLKHVVEVFQTRLRRFDSLDRFQLGFTGARSGPTAAQTVTWLRLVIGNIDTIQPNYVRMPAVDFHSGCALGADRYVVADTPGNWQHTFYPSDALGYRWAMETHRGVVRPLRPPLSRNHDIVDASEVVVAMPSTFAEIMHSGTWATIRYARKKHVPVLLILPDGALGWDGSLRGRSP